MAVSFSEISMNGNSPDSQPCVSASRVFVIKTEPCRSV